MNEKNKIFGSTRNLQGPTSSSSEEVQVIEKIYDDRKSRAETIEAYNEKSSSDRERSGSYDFDCCNDNSLYESSCIYAKARIASSKVIIIH